MTIAIGLIAVAVYLSLPMLAVWYIFPGGMHATYCSQLLAPNCLKKEDESGYCLKKIS